MLAFSDTAGGLWKLSPREREVVATVVFGMLNKQIATEIGTTRDVSIRFCNTLNFRLSRELAPNL